MNNGIDLRPSYWASVSGGKDSLYMLNLILHKLDKYPLDGVVHFELEIDYPFIKEVINYMEVECSSRGIPFYRFKPKQTWEELYDKYGFPTRKARWCNNKYKLSAKKSLEEFLKSKGRYLVSYIGYCSDEESRFSKRNLNKTEIYPLVLEGINENIILKWARTQPIFNDYYKFNKRCGCMYCPMSSMTEQAYLLKYYPHEYEYLIKKAMTTEENMTLKLGRQFSIWSINPKYNTKYRDNIIRGKWLPKLEDMLIHQQISMDDLARSEI